MRIAAYTKAHCRQCAPIANKLPGVICDQCFDICCDIIASNRRQFQKLIESNRRQKLIASGVSHSMANEIMIRRIDGETPS